ncbi:MAG TPA: hypothetical protein VHO84_10050 [Syntrophorhabdaceae bacterium]|nr:hypothetical protein [Syntrophorhabdaceae bacterium]
MSTIQHRRFGEPDRSSDRYVHPAFELGRFPIGSFSILLKVNIFVLAGANVHLILACLFLAATLAFSGCSHRQDTSKLPQSSATYQQVNSDVGCDSRNSDERKKDIFETRYRDHWMRWRGMIVLADSNVMALNMSGKDTQELRVNLAEKGAGYNFKKGQFVTLKFLLRAQASCTLPFFGEEASVIR